MTRKVFTSRSIGTILALLAVCTVAVVALVHQPQEVQLVAFLLPLLAIWYLCSKGRSDARLSWQLPLVGYASTFAIGAGLSLSNQDLRTDVELVGASAFAVVTVLGITHLYKGVRAIPGEKPRQWKKDVAAGLVCNLLLAWLVTSLAQASYEAKHRPAPAGMISIDQGVGLSESARPAPVWIDTDPACGVGTAVDVDDCWALLAAIRSPELVIRGISTVFGNQDGTRALAFAQEILPRLIEGSQMGDHPPNIYGGDTGKRRSTWPPTPASRALASALEPEPLTIIALGPLTNLAKVIRTHPDAVNKIGRIVLVGGKRPGQLFHPGHHWWFHFGDFNVSHDPEAAEIVLYSGVPITLVPFELATKLFVTESDLDRLSAGDRSAKWLSDVSRPWLTFWNTMLEKPGFHPFDVLAVAYAAMPDHFRCTPIPARIGFNLFLEPFGMGRDLEIAQDIHGPIVINCFDLNPELKDILLVRLTGPSRSSFGMATSLPQVFTGQ